MVDDTLKPALRAALRCNEIGDDIPLSFVETFRAEMAAAGFDQAQIDGWVEKIATHVASDPISPEPQEMNLALAASSGLIDVIEERIFTSLYGSLDKCSGGGKGGLHNRAGGTHLYSALDQHDGGAHNFAHMADR
jgi:hypothetical protein